MGLWSICTSMRIHEASGFIVVPPGWARCLWKCRRLRIDWSAGPIFLKFSKTRERYTFIYLVFDGVICTMFLLLVVGLTRFLMVN